MKVRNFLLFGAVSIVFSLAFVLIMALAPLNAEAKEQTWTAMENFYAGYDGNNYYKKATYNAKIYDNSVKGYHLASLTGGYDMFTFKLVPTDGSSAKLSYCIAAGLAYRYLNTYYTDLSNASYQSYFKALPQSAQDGIKLAQICGYDGSETSPVANTNWFDMYMATQTIVWEYQQGIRTSPTQIADSDGVAWDTFYSTIRSRPAELCYNYILNRMNEYQTSPSFCEEPVAISTQSDIQTISLHDDNIRLSGYAKYIVVDVNTGKQVPGISISNSGADYTLTIETEIDETMQVALVHEATFGKADEATYFVAGENDQPLVSVDYMGDDIKFVLTLSPRVSDGSITVSETINISAGQTAQDDVVVFVCLINVSESENRMLTKAIVFTTDEINNASQNRVTKSVTFYELGAGVYQTYALYPMWGTDASIATTQYVPLSSGSMDGRADFQCQLLRLPGLRASTYLSS